MAATSLFKRKPLPEGESEESAVLQPCFETFHLSLIGIGSALRCFMLFSFFLVSNITGPSACVSFVVGGILSLSFGACFVDLASNNPSSGSVYTYTFSAMGEVVAFIVGWTALCDYLLQASYLAKAASSSLDLMVSGNISSYLLHNGGALSGVPTSNFTTQAPPILDETLDPVAAVLLLLIGLLLLLSTRVSITVTGGLCCALLGAIFAIFTACFVIGNGAQFSYSFLKYGTSGFRKSLALSPICFSFFEAIAVTSGEARKPSQDLPVASALNFGLVTGLLAMAATAAAFLQPIHAASFAAAFKASNHIALFFFTASVTLVAYCVGAFISLFLASRYAFAMAREGSLPFALSHVLSISKQPWLAIAVSSLGASIASLLLHQELLASICNVSAAVTILAIAVSLFLIRYLPDQSSELSFRPILARFFQQRTCSEWLRHRSFFKATLLLLIISVMVALFFLDRLKVPFIGSLFAIAAVVAFFMLWLYEPKREESGFRARGLPILCAVSALLSGALLFEMTTEATFRLFTLTFLGLVMFAGQKVASYRSSDYSTLEGENGTGRGAFERRDTARRTM